MRKIFDYLESFAGDKYVRLLVCLFLAFAVGKAELLIWHRGWLVSLVAGVLVSAVACLAKELTDFFRDLGFDKDDMKAGAIGAVIGAVLAVI